MALILIVWVEYLCKIICFELDTLNSILCAHKFDFMGSMMHIKSKKYDAEHLFLIVCVHKVDFMCPMIPIKSEVYNTADL